MQAKIQITLLVDNNVMESERSVEHAIIDELRLAAANFVIPYSLGPFIVKSQSIEVTEASFYTE